MNTAQFHLTELIKQQQESGNAWLEFFNISSLSIGVYNIPEGSSDRESHDPHDRDEVYVGVRGKGLLTVGRMTYEIEANTIVFVKAGVEHHFHDVTEDLDVLVFFAGPTETTSSSRKL